MNAASNNFWFPDFRSHLGRADFAIALATFLCAFLIFTRGNDFPAHYHPDEPSKVRQVRAEEYNFNHPLLLLQTTKGLLLTTPEPWGQAQIVRAGRTASALFCALAAAFVALIAAHFAGPLAATATGLLVISNQQIFELAHYMKEDPALALGVCAAALAFVRCLACPTAIRWAALGAGCALAISGKYLGALTLMLPVAALFLTGKSWRNAGWCLGAGLIVLLAVNLPILGSLGEFSSNLGREMDYAVSGHKGLTRPVPHGVYGAVFREATNPAIWVLLAAFYASLGLAWIPKMTQLLRLTKPPISLVVLSIFPLVYVALLSFSPKTHHRYFLPLTFFFLLLAALAPFRFRVKQALPIGMLFLLAGLGISVSKTLEYDRGFENDARQALITFLANNLPPNAIIAQDKRVGLPVEGQDRFEDSGMTLPQKVVGKLFAADVGSVQELRNMGIRYVAVSDGDYGRFFLKTHKPRPEEAAEFARRKAFYEEVFSTGKLLWESPGGRLQYLQPSIKLYELP